MDLVAVADPDPEGRAAAGERTGAQRLYADYRQMLADEDLDLVSVCPRMPDCHADMVIACAEAGVRGVFIEKPLTPSLREADALLAGLSGARRQDRGGAPARQSLRAIRQKAG